MAPGPIPSIRRGGGSSRTAALRAMRGRGGDCAAAVDRGGTAGHGGVAAEADSGHGAADIVLAGGGGGVGSSTRSFDGALNPNRQSAERVARHTSSKRVGGIIRARPVKPASCDNRPPHTLVVDPAVMPGPRPLIFKDSTSMKWTFLNLGIFLDTQPAKNVFGALESSEKSKETKNP